MFTPSLSRPVPEKPPVLVSATFDQSNQGGIAWTIITYRCVTGPG